MNLAAGFPTWSWATNSFFNSGYLKGKSHLRKSKEWTFGSRVCGMQNSDINYQNISHPNSWCLFVVQTDHPYMLVEKLLFFQRSDVLLFLLFQVVVTLWTQLEQRSSYFLWGQSIRKAWRATLGQLTSHLFAKQKRNADV